MPFHSQKELSGPDATRIDADIIAGTFVDATFQFYFFFSQFVMYCSTYGLQAEHGLFLYDILCLIADGWYFIYLLFDHVCGHLCLPVSLIRTAEKAIEGDTRPILEITASSKLSWQDFVLHTRFMVSIHCTGFISLTVKNTS